MGVAKPACDTALERVYELGAGNTAKSRRTGLRPLQELVDAGRVSLEKFFGAGHGHSLDAVRESYRSPGCVEQAGFDAEPHLEAPGVVEFRNKMGC